VKLVITENITLDGVVEATGGWFTPAGDEEAVDNSDIEGVLHQHMAQQDGLLLGRVTFEEMRGYWPLQTNDTTGITDHLNRIHKYVATRSLVEPGWDNTTVLSGPLREQVTALKDTPGRDLGLTGSIAVGHDLIEAGLVDEYRLFVYPVVIGGGRRLFPDGTDLGKLQFAEAKPFRSGVVLMTYRA
jgi:dihydrofolate reductase